MVMNRSKKGINGRIFNSREIRRKMEQNPYPGSKHNQRNAAGFKIGSNTIKGQRAF
jgi:hypothetical protein